MIKRTRFTFVLILILLTFLQRAAADAPDALAVLKTPEICIYMPNDASYMTERLVYNALNSVCLRICIERLPSGADCAAAAQGMNNAIIAGLNEQAM